MNKKICFDCSREIPQGREVRLREDGLGWGIGGGRWGGGWGGGGGWGTSGDAAFLWICTSCYRKRKRRRLIITLIIIGIFVAIFLGTLVWTLIRIGKHS
ncbi:MAG: hypothetical protein MRECE_1c160 [Mycoplasmataceae bacterium CE_OT135]|nr:MAG: hypothetical protein MRECE_1c007 [Mycoplasmataceae bacterium CE_OT135]KLL04372.1 MAG: hypothetical protein MRECE_1c160 [Mycoplasmataceae bacterium CE_OT135]